ncbi:NYN domain-containing protein [Pseudoduganella violacea]|uniref:Uncharacterized LabA/DUF88 family protein n=1 Tax=Pseudoduganella violacea TaxID=1715466 RepID=A0A7W5B9C1_9BURK|nr:uncharacterized LabA/DUF88 family protein [Pseudoduganella violacea]
MYVDAFNLYFGSLKGTPYRWLNILAMCRAYLPGNDITAIKYFTAKVSARPNDPQQPARQQAYLRALVTIPCVEIIYGHYLSHTVRARLAVPPVSGPATVEVIKTEEKGSDVNLATHLIHDAHLNRFDIAVVVSNDSDLLTPIKLARADLGKLVGILNPQRHPSRALLPHIDFLKQIRGSALAASQFPAQLLDARGRVIHKPIGW